MSRPARITLAVVGAIVLLNAAIAAIGALFPSPSGPASSSYATAPEGLAAFADLLERSGHPVGRLRGLPGDVRLDRDSTVVLLDPDLLRPDEARVLRRFVEGGGRLVAGGRRPDPWITALLPADPVWRGRSPRSWRPAAPVAATQGVRRVRSAGEGAWGSAGAVLPALVAGGGSSLLLTAGPGDGQLLVLADASPLQNRLLARADNAAFGVALAGERGRPVQFMEAVHGYGSARGLDALPGAWKLALAGLALAGLVFVAARARRLGPPDVPQRTLPPPRRAYVEALASALERTRDSAAVAAPLQEAARARLTARFRLADDAQPSDLQAAARRAGLEVDEAAAVVEAARREEQLIAAGRALVRLDARGGGDWANIGPRRDTGGGR